MREHSGGNVGEQKKKEKKTCVSSSTDSKYRMKHYTRFNVFRDYKPCICICEGDTDNDT